MKRRNMQQSLFQVPESKSLVQLTGDKEGDLKEEIEQFLALLIDEKMMIKLKVEEELEKEENMKNQKHVKSKKTAPKHKELKMAMLKRENFTKESKHDLISMERQKAVLELLLMTKRGDIIKMDETIKLQESELKECKKLIEQENLKSEEFLRENEKKSTEARTLFEQESKSKQEKTGLIKKLNAEIGSIKSEIAKSEEILIEYMQYKDFLFSLSPPEWQKAQRTKAGRAEVPSEESARINGSENTQSEPGRETHPRDSSRYEDEPELYFTDPQQLLDLIKGLKRQILSLCQSSTLAEKKARERRQSIETTMKTFKKHEDQLALQINDKKSKIDNEKAKYNNIQQSFQLLLSLKTEGQDEMFDALSKRVAEVHQSCVGDMATNLSTSEKLTSLEKQLFLLLKSLESIPKGTLERLKKIKDSEKRSREREQKLWEQQEKQKERMRRYLERSLADSKKASGKKLMPRSMPVVQKVKVIKEDKIFPDLVTSDDLKE